MHYKRGKEDDSSSEKLPGSTLEQFAEEFGVDPVVDFRMLLDDVGLEMRAMIGPVGASRARERSFASVGSNVGLQIKLFHENFRTE